MGQNEDYSPGDSISESSEKLLQRVWGQRQYRCDFGEGGVHAVKHIVFAEGLVSASHEEHTSPRKILVLF